MIRLQWEHLYNLAFVSLFFDECLKFKKKIKTKMGGSFDLLIFKLHGFKLIFLQVVIVDFLKMFTKK